MSSPLILETHLEQFDQEVLKASYDTPVLVDFWADWCGPCRILAPTLEQLAQGREDSLRIAKVEVDEGENMKLAGRYGLRGFPTVILFIDGEEKARFSSAKTLGWIEDFLKPHLPACAPTSD